MNILLCSHRFPPSVGGIETVSKILAEQFALLGHRVTVVTDSPGEDGGDRYQIVRRPSLRLLLRASSDSDVIFQNNISMRTLLPLFLAGKPIVVAHHTWLTRADGSRGWQDYLKRWVLPLCHNVAVSSTLARSLPIEAELIKNPFEATQFLPFRLAPRDLDLVFMGRLVSDKGCDLVIKAVAALKGRKRNVTLSVIGDGSERSALEFLASQLGVSDRVTFLGTIKSGRAAILARHRVIVIPSRWIEPFGLVALEGIAAGCVPVASNSGGLLDAVSDCGVFFQPADLESLVEAIVRLLDSSELRESFREKACPHLDQHAPEIIAKNYIELFTRITDVKGVKGGA